MPKRYGLLMGFLLAGYAVFAQTDITGLWKGTLYNDTTRIYYRYEIAISEEKPGRYSGYSHTWFILEDKQYFGLKKVKIRREGSKIITEDDGLVSHNYPVAPAKGVRQLNILELETRGDSLILTGPFMTNATKVYSPLTGNIRVQRRNDYAQSSLVPHLEELGLVKNLHFIQPIASRAPEKPAKPEMLIPVSIPEQTTVSIAAEPELVLPKNQQPEAISTLPATTEKKPIVPPAQVEARINLEKPSSVALPSAALEFKKREVAVQHQLVSRQDSIQITLYDNGEVDGDTVTVLINGEVWLARQPLSTRAVRKTYTWPAGIEKIELVMYAESLGSIPPNTGLLIVKDGKDLYELRFSGDFTRSAGVLISRAKKE